MQSVDRDFAEIMNVVKFADAAQISVFKCRDVFTISHVVLLKQTGTSDSCLTSHEEELFEVLEKHDVVTLGWIHTHPSQSAFLSSVDLHTQFSYQSMLPEAIAIVYAPKHKQLVLEISLNSF